MWNHFNNYTQLLGYKVRTNRLKETDYTLQGTIEFSIYCLMEYLDRTHFQTKMQKMVDTYHEFIEKILEPNLDNLNHKDIAAEKRKELKPMIEEMIAE